MTLGTVRARVRGLVREGSRTVIDAVDDAGRAYSIEVPADLELPPGCSTCGPSCGCAPCRLRHTGEHTHDHGELREDLILIVAWSLHALPAVDAHEYDDAPSTAVARPTPAGSPPPTPAEIDGAFMALMGCLKAAPPPAATATSAPGADPIAAFFGLTPSGAG